ncbi:hypothetical protein ABW19_dt0206253 [Dactylella cylindrospora]|nr:hypothetical protein ABW19_dt0206253 [Dactylella cylindrospora]
MAPRSTLMRPTAASMAKAKIYPNGSASVMETLTLKERALQKQNGQVVDDAPDSNIWDIKAAEKQAQPSNRARAPPKLSKSQSKGPEGLTEPQGEVDAPKAKSQLQSMPSKKKQTSKLKSKSDPDREYVPHASKKMSQKPSKQIPNRLTRASKHQITSGPKNTQSLGESRSSKTSSSGPQGLGGPTLVEKPAGQRAEKKLSDGGPQPAVKLKQYLVKTRARNPPGPQRPDRIVKTKPKPTQNRAPRNSQVVRRTAQIKSSQSTWIKASAVPRKQSREPTPISDEKMAWIESVFRGDNIPKIIAPPTGLLREAWDKVQKMKKVPVRITDPCKQDLVAEEARRASINRANSEQRRKASNYGQILAGNPDIMVDPLPRIVFAPEHYDAPCSRVPSPEKQVCSPRKYVPPRTLGDVQREERRFKTWKIAAANGVAEVSDQVSSILHKELEDKLYGRVAYESPCRANKPNIDTIMDIGVALTSQLEEGTSPRKTLNMHPEDWDGYPKLQDAIVRHHDQTRRKAIDRTPHRYRTPALRLIPAGPADVSPNKVQYDDLQNRATELAMKLQKFKQEQEEWRRYHNIVRFEEPTPTRVLKKPLSRKYLPLGMDQPTRRQKAYYQGAYTKRMNQVDNTLRSAAKRKSRIPRLKSLRNREPTFSRKPAQQFHRTVANYTRDDVTSNTGSQISFDVPAPNNETQILIEKQLLDNHNKRVQQTKAFIQRYDAELNKRKFAALAEFKNAQDEEEQRLKEKRLKIEEDIAATVKTMPTMFVEKARLVGKKIPVDEHPTTKRIHDEYREVEEKVEDLGKLKEDRIRKVAEQENRLHGYKDEIISIAETMQNDIDNMDFQYGVSIHGEEYMKQRYRVPAGYVPPEDTVGIIPHFGWVKEKVVDMIETAPHMSEKIYKQMVKGVLPEEDEMDIDLSSQ